MKEEFPQEFYTEIDNNENLLGRISVNLINAKFNIEVDIVFKESRKIFKHVGQDFAMDDKFEAVDIGVMHLSKYLKGLSQPV